MTQRNPYVRSRAPRLAVEVLEPRDCPACTVVQAGHTVNILGDGGANTITISEAGPPTTAAAMTITADGITTTYAGGTIARVYVQTRAGDDVVTYKSAVVPGREGISLLSISLGTGNDLADVTDSQAISTAVDVPGRWSVMIDGSAGDDTVVTRFGRMDLQALRVRANLGEGNDTFAALFAGPIATLSGKPTAIGLNVQGGAGNDSIDLQAAAQVEGTYLTAIFQGGEGDDEITMAVDFAGNRENTVHLEALGGSGSDFMSVDVTEMSSATPDSIRNRVVMNGGSGDDDLSLNAASKKRFFLTIDGGADFDTYWPGSLSVRPLNCEVVMP